MDDSSNGRAVALYPADPGSNPRSGSIWDFFVSETRLDGYIMSDPLTNWNPKREVDLKYQKKQKKINHVRYYLCKIDLVYLHWVN